MPHLVLLVLLSVAGFPAQAGSQSPSAPERQRAQQHFRSGWEALRAESWDEARAEFQSTIDIIPGYTLAYSGLGRANMGGKRYADAIGAFERCRDLYRLAAGRQFSSQLDGNRARQDQELELREAIRATSQGPQTQRSQEVVRQLQQQLRLTQQASDRGINVSMETGVPAFVSLSLGSAYFRAGRLADAEREYKTAVAADAQLGEAWNNLGVVYAMTNRYADAARALEAAEKAGFHVNPQLKSDLAKKKKSGEGIE
jgi:tetratricopeptide (TPR) repeat protein